MAPVGCAYLSSRRAQNTSFVRGEAAGSGARRARRRAGEAGRALGVNHHHRRCRCRLSSSSRRRRLPAESRAAPPSPGPYEAPCDPLTSGQPRPPLFTPLGPSPPLPSRWAAGHGASPARRHRPRRRPAASLRRSACERVWLRGGGRCRAASARGGTATQLALGQLARAAGATERGGTGFG